ncbi:MULTISPECIES: patatin-like phospholipase family protein [unclassified Variovorax]|uniref:patatin-like phospholipase family protein n=1 Tax=unclassified Variovorax TaxID=663243 RepID=UPI000D130DB7|nr:MULTISPECIES: patatin-like phospholipase family protein [unclassified Variovorax]AVQ80344.1 phospholipase [Variovorax sp. PMC12]QRY30249.1 patatin-like phospholipase family protein [Variovorax sp. PDNC026]
MKALRIYAGPAARKHIEQHGLRPQDVRTIPGAAGGPKGLILGPLDRFIFGRWLTRSSQQVHLVGASIGAWRLSTACLTDPEAAFQRFEHDYVRQQFEVPPGQKRLSPQQLSERFAESLDDFYGGRIAEVLNHPRYRLHVVTSRGRHILGREGMARTPVGYLGAFATNSLHRKGLGAWLERCVFSTPGAALPFGTRDFRTRQHALSEANFNMVLQASCSIPFLLAAVHDIPGAPRGAYWDGGITDYHLHLDYQSAHDGADDGLVLYPHFQQAVVPGWLDKGLRWRHKASGFLDRMVVLAPDPEWVKKLPNGKLPDRKDFIRFASDAPARIAAWSQATREAQRLSDEFEDWLQRDGVPGTLPL